MLLPEIVGGKARIYKAFPSRIFPPSALSMDAELEDWVLEAGDLITARHLGSIYTKTSFTTGKEMYIDFSRSTHIK